MCFCVKKKKLVWSCVVLESQTIKILLGSYKEICGMFLKKLLIMFDCLDLKCIPKDLKTTEQISEYVEEISK